MQNAAPVQLSQVRDFGQIISTTFVFLKQNWRPLGRALAVICVPPAVISGFFIGKTMGDIQSVGLTTDPGNPFGVYNGMLNAWVPMGLGYLLLIASFLLMTTVTYEYIRAYHLNEHLGLTPGELWKRSMSQIGQYFGMNFLSGLLIVLGFLLCILPGLYVISVLSLALAVHAIERKGASGSLGRSNNLVKDRFWETLGLVIVIGIIHSFITGILMLPFSIVSMMVTFNSTFDAIRTEGQTALPGWFAMYTAFTTSLQMAITLLTYPIVAVALSLKYFTLVEEKEGAGFRKKLEGFDQA